MNIKEMAAANAESAFDCANEYSSLWVSIGAYNKNALDTLGDYGIDTLENQLLVNKAFMQRVTELLEEKTIRIKVKAVTKMSKLAQLKEINNVLGIALEIDDLDAAAIKIIEGLRVMQSKGAKSQKTIDYFDGMLKRFHSLPFSVSAKNEALDNARIAVKL